MASKIVNANKNIQQQEQDLEIDRVNYIQTFERDFRIDFNKYSEETKDQIIYILLHLLEYPSTKIAKQHRKANRLGNFDLNPDSNSSSPQQQLNDQSKKAHCKDCGLVIQDQQIPICTSFDLFPKIGIATYLFFQSIKNLILMIVILTAIYSAYSLNININQPSSSLNSTNLPKKMSFASTIQNLNSNPSLYDSMLIQGWLIITTVIVWWTCLFAMINIKIKHERMVDNETTTAADFSLMIENVPIMYSKEDLQKDLVSYYESLSQRKDLHQKDELKPFVIRQFCKAIPFYYLDDESIKQKIAEIEKKMDEKREQIAQMILDAKINQQLPLNKQKRKQMYDEYLKLSSQKKQQQKQLKELSKNYAYMQQLNVKTIVFVSFLYSESANVIDIANPYGFSNKMRYYLSCCQKALFFKPKSLQGTQVIALRAPQPEDIVWENIGIPQNEIFKRKMLTYLVTLFLLATSFGIVYGLTILQQTYKNAVLSILISLSITVINILLGIAIRRLTIYESDISPTYRQISLAIKSILAQMINSILIPVITNIYIENNIYQVNGLVYDVFYLSITSAFLPPVLKFIDIPYLLKKFTIWKYKNPFEKIQLSQKQLNSIYEYSQMQLGVQYIYYIDLFQFTCFYVHVHPFIVVFTFIGFSMMYWVQKHSLLSRSKRPTSSSALINEAMTQMIAFSPCVFSLGGLIWFNIVRQDYYTFSSNNFLSRMVAIILSVVFYLLPFNSCCNALCYIADDEQLNYDQVQSKLTSQYNLLNPVTAEESLEQFLNKDKKATKRIRLPAINLKRNLKEQASLDKLNLTKFEQSFNNTNGQNLIYNTNQEQKQLNEDEINQNSKRPLKGIHKINLIEANVLKVKTIAEKHQNNVTEP